MFADIATFAPLLRLLAVFALMLLGVRLRLGLGLSVLIGSLVLALWFDMSAWQWAVAGLGIFGDAAIVLVWCVLSLILALSALMERSGQAERFMIAFSHHIKSPRIRLIFFPILIGLLPMPGGAVFSAPLIQAVARGMPVPEVDKSLINYWFRHTVEMSWPLFPSIILAASLGGITTPQLILYTCPLILAFFSAGWFFLVRVLEFPPTSDIPDSGLSVSWATAFYQGLPIFLALGGALALEGAIALLLPGVPVDYGVPVALTVGIVVCLRQNNLNAAVFFRVIFQRHVLNMICIVGALGVFKIILEKCGAIDALMRMGSADMALILAAVVLPGLVGLVTGLLMACVGIALPLLMAIMPEGEVVLPWLALALTSGITGTMISPLHICFVLSCEYFKVDFTACWRRIPAPSLFFGFAGLLYFFLMK
jgi:integral membrane protein (TIGR00529 family)